MAGYPVISYTARIFAANSLHTCSFDNDSFSFRRILHGREILNSQEKH